MPAAWDLQHNREVCGAHPLVGQVAQEGDDGGGQGPVVALEGALELGDEPVHQQRGDVDDPRADDGHQGGKDRGVGGRGDLGLHDALAEQASAPVQVLRTHPWSSYPVMKAQAQRQESFTALPSALSAHEKQCLTISQSVEILRMPRQGVLHRGGPLTRAP